METNSKILIALVLGIGLAGLGMLVKHKEYYGGKIKKIRRIPFNDCIGICDQYKRRCYQDNRYADPGFCDERFGPTGFCVSECYYSSHQRM